MAAPSPSADSFTLSRVTYSLAQGQDCLSAIKTLLSKRRTGQITIHISNGHVGGVEWMEKVKPDPTIAQNPLTS